MPQHFSMPVKFFSASFISALIWSIPSSILSSCSEFNKKKKVKILIKIYTGGGEECVKVSGKINYSEHFGAPLQNKFAPKKFSERKKFKK